MKRTRRRLLSGTASVLAAGALSGCTGRLREIAGEETLDDGGYAAFFTLYDFARHVGGEVFPVENPVPPGTMGHRYEPGPDLPTEVASHRAFLYMDVEGFQRWALDAAETIERDHPEVELVDVLEGIELREYEDDHTHEDDNTHTEGDDHVEEEDHSDGAHDDAADRHGDFDPHYWTDPVLAAESVENVIEGLQAADPDDEDVYAENGQAYLDRLDELHRTFEEGLADRERDTVVVASHDSYQYLAERYGLQIHSPQGVSPHAQPTQEEIQETVGVVDRNDIDVILVDHFGSADLANAIIGDSNASEIRRISPAEGTTAEWNDRGWGYIEQMERINLPALQAALGINA
ncbi:metal ABC transporter substrate-binding protein [Halopenitus salinus]|uniref:Metal ABC transporter substrate-binding protein n=1 Tax=Halopenitus salinus TaxID=1198295 RepID=A0ABD5V081_9EURY